MVGCTSTNSACCGVFFVLSAVYISHVIKWMETLSNDSTPPPPLCSVYPASRVTGGGGKGNGGNDKDKPRGVPGTVELLQSRIIAPQVCERMCLCSRLFKVWSFHPSIRSPTPTAITKSAGGGLRLAPAAGGFVRAQRPGPDPPRLPCHQATVLLESVGEGEGRGVQPHTHKYTHRRMLIIAECVPAKKREKTNEAMNT